MSDWVTVAAEHDFVVGSYRVVPLDDVEVVVVRTATGFYAVENRCTHADVPLAGGALRDETITCPKHGAQFCLKTGAALTPPAVEALATFPVRVANGWVQVRDARWD
uniref:Rieske 2Fe-2S family protein n=1 Tax=uncultured beta proteobacterium TaxID=86027 RepID=H5S9V2_9PROT|nr:Rieske 2Fe-2S family protein [uncultured beta proteobacterium]